MNDKVNFTRADLKRFKKAYEAELRKGKDGQPRDIHDTFTFDGREWVIGYAKYAIEYLESQLK